MRENEIKLSIVLCTYNNCESLGLTLKQLADNHFDDKSLVELIVVDNNSKDQTVDVFNESMGEFDYPVHYLFENKQGLSHARNLGLHNAQGEYVLFTDDDADVPLDWIQRYFDVIGESRPDCLYSKISIIWDRAKPSWFIEEYNPFFVRLDYGDKSIFVDDYQHEFYGKNFCVLKSKLLSFGGFDPKLGRCGDRLIAGEETLIYQRLIKNECKVIYFPGACVGHRLKDREYDEKNIHNLMVDSAYSIYHLSKVNAKKTFFDRPLYPLKLAVLDGLKNIVGLAKYRLNYNCPRCLYSKLSLMRNFKLICLWCVNP